MAGKKQHYIPQCFLKGFAARHSKDRAYVYVFKKNQKPYLSPTEDVAAERFFYSELSTDNAKTLDDEITDFENILAPLLNTLRGAKDNQSVSSDIAIKVIVHLAIRSAHVRNVFEAAINTFMSSIQDVMSSESGVRKLLGIDSHKPSPVFLEEIERATDALRTSLPADVPKQLIERILRVQIRERFTDFFSQQSGSISSILDLVAGNMPSIVRNAHTNALGLGLVPEECSKKIAHLSWRVQSFPAGTLILPDCVALAKGKDSEVLYPYALNELNEIEEIYFPISANKIVIGSSKNNSTFSASYFNQMAASCCSMFFVSSVASEEHDVLANIIGEYTVSSIFPLAKEAIEELRAELLVTPKNQKSDVDSPRILESISVLFPTGTDQERARVVGDAIRTVALEVSRTFPLTRLASITFVKTEENLHQPNRGISAAHVGDDVLPYFFLQSDVAKFGVIFHNETADALYSFKTGDAVSNSALYIPMFQLAFAGHREKLYKTIPAIFTTPLSDPWNNTVLICIEHFVGAYVSSFFCASVTPSVGEGLAESLLVTLNQAQEQITKERLAYRTHGDLDNFLGFAINWVRAILWYASRLIGHYHGIGQSPFGRNAALQNKLKEMDLLHWVGIFEHDLRKTREQYGVWTTTEDALSLGVHIERLLWPFAVLPWRNEKGEAQVLIPLGIDAVALATLKK